MNGGLRAQSVSGRRCVALAEAIAQQFWKSAGASDASGTFSKSNTAAMKEQGLYASCVPEAHGGGGIDRVFDKTLLSVALGRGCPSTALAANMHFDVSWLMGDLLRRRPDDVQAPMVAGLLVGIGNGDLAVCGSFSERGTDLLHPQTQAEKVEGGWCLNGRKMFATGSPGADLIGTSVRIRSAGEAPGLAIALVPPGAPGLRIEETWDALGMRASGSHDLVFDDCIVPDAMVRRLGNWGSWNEDLLRFETISTLGLTGVFLGIAESAQQILVDQLRASKPSATGRRAIDRYSIQSGVGSNEMALSTARALLARACSQFDERVLLGEDVALEGLHALMAEAQAAKTVVNRLAIEILDRALGLSGGVGYLARHPLSRLYRDVRAGPFMQPYSPNEAFEYVGKVALELEPTVDR